MKNVVWLSAFLTLSAFANVGVLRRKIVDVKIPINDETFYCDRGEGLPSMMNVVVPKTADFLGLNYGKSVGGIVLSAKGCIVDFPEQVVEAKLEVSWQVRHELIDDFVCNRSLIEKVQLKLFEKVFSDSQLITQDRTNITNCRNL